VGCPRKCRDRGDEHWLAGSVGDGQVSQLGCDGEVFRAMQSGRGRRRYADAQGRGVAGGSECWRDMGSCGLVVSHPVPPAKRWNQASPRAEGPQCAQQVSCVSGRVCDNASAMHKGSRAWGVARNAGVRWWWCREVICVGETARGPQVAGLAAA
jgi:hypothetical protein